jgi:hypothetical protein
VFKQDDDDRRGTVLGALNPMRVVKLEAQRPIHVFAPISPQLLHGQRPFAVEPTDEGMGQKRYWAGIKFFDGGDHKRGGDQCLG